MLVNFRLLTNVIEITNDNARTAAQLVGGSNARCVRRVAQVCDRKGWYIDGARNPHEIRAIGLSMLKNFSFDWYRKRARGSCAKLT